MNLSNLQFFQMARQQMDYLDQRHEVVAENIANSDTPGYRAQKLEAPSFRQRLSESQGLQPARTQPGHQGGGGGGLVQPAATNAAHMAGTAGGDGPEQSRDTAYETTPDGNSVSLEQQMRKLADNQIQHDMATRLYQKNVGFIRTALGQGGGGG